MCCSSRAGPSSHHTPVARLLPQCVDQGNDAVAMPGQIGVVVGTHRQAQADTFGEDVHDAWVVGVPTDRPGHPRRRGASALHHRRNKDIAVPCLGPLDDDPDFIMLIVPTRPSTALVSTPRNNRRYSCCCPGVACCQNCPRQNRATPSISTTRSRKGCRRWRLASEEPAVAMIAASSSPTRRMYVAAHDGPASPRVSTSGTAARTAEPIAQSSGRLVEYMSTCASNHLEC